jgi:diacylglycerol kinase (ATP)
MALEMESKKQKLVFITNPTSGYRKGLKLQKYIDLYLDLSKFEYEIQYTEYGGHAKKLAYHAQKEGIYCIIACGGDGTINEISSALVNTNTAIGLLPMGSGNGLSYHIGIRRSISKAFDVINNGKIKKIDSAVVDEYFFVNVAGFGLDAKVAFKTKENKKRGLSQYVINTIKYGFRYKGVNLTISDNNDNNYQGNYAIVAIANGSIYGFDFAIAPSAFLDDGLLNVVLITKANVLDYIVLAWYMFRRQTYRSKLVKQFTASSLNIEIEGKQYLHVDGEGKKTSGSIEAKINPNSIMLLSN